MTLRTMTDIIRPYSRSIALDFVIFLMHQHWHWMRSRNNSSPDRPWSRWILLPVLLQIGRRKGKAGGINWRRTGYSFSVNETFRLEVTDN